MAKTVLILGGVRSGKSRFARELAEKIAGDEVLFVATATACDAEMSHRIERHQRDRPAAWRVFEQPLQLGAALATAPERYQVVLVDCLTLLVSNILLSCENHQDADAVEDLVRTELAAIVVACRERPGTVIIVSGEVGQGVVPEHRLGRIFRDLLGMANQILAATAETVYLMVAGLPVEIKSLAATVATAAQAPAKDHESMTLSAGEIGSR